MSDFDYIVVGAGSAGCVLANRLSASPHNQVLVLEAGGKDQSPLIRIPRGFGKLLADDHYTWHLGTRPFGSTQRVEYWARGKTLGGSSSINGMVYNRGSAADWNEIEGLGNAGWGWDAILPIYRTIEDNQLGASPTRGAGGPLTISPPRDTDALCEAMIDAGAAIGMRRVADFNESDDARIGSTMATISSGRRVSAAKAFLHPVTDRANLSVAVDSFATRILFDGDTAVGVEVLEGGRRVEHRARRSVILSLGSLHTPKLLQLSGIGPAEVLRDAGVDVRIDQAGVGGRMREHRCFTMQFRLRDNVGYNKRLSTPLQQVVSGAQYFLTHRGPLAAPAYDVIGFARTDPGAARPDAQLLMAPFSATPQRPGADVGLEREPGLQCIGYILRPESEGRLRITAADPQAPLDIDPQFFASPYDRKTGVALFHKMREMFSSPAIAARLDHETLPGASVTGDDDIIDSALVDGYCGYHAVGTCAMGPDADDVVDPQLRVRGIDHLRVVDCSVMPTMVSGNLNGPMMAMAWHAADLILDEVEPHS